MKGAGESSSWTTALPAPSFGGDERFRPTASVFRNVGAGASMRMRLAFDERGEGLPGVAQRVETTPDGEQQGGQF